MDGVVTHKYNWKNNWKKGWFNNPKPALSNLTKNERSGQQASASQVCNQVIVNMIGYHGKVASENMSM